MIHQGQDVARHRGGAGVLVVVMQGQRVGTGLDEIEIGAVDLAGKVGRSIRHDVEINRSARSVDNGAAATRQGAGAGQVAHRLGFAVEVKRRTGIQRQRIGIHGRGGGGEGGWSGELEVQRVIGHTARTELEGTEVQGGGAGVAIDVAVVEDQLAVAALGQTARGRSHSTADVGIHLQGGIGKRAACIEDLEDQFDGVGCQRAGDGTGIEVASACDGGGGAAVVEQATALQSHRIQCVDGQGSGGCGARERQRVRLVGLIVCGGSQQSL